MFSGIVDRPGYVGPLHDRPGGREISIAPRDGDGFPPWGNVAVGESISVSGVCLTAVRVAERLLFFDVVPETLARTTLGLLQPGDAVNLERSLALGDRLGGHFVSGHVDGVGEVLLRRPEGDQVLFRIGAPPGVLCHLIPKGSVAVDGVALTVIDVDRSGGWFSFAAVPHTLERTTLGKREVGEAVNLEGDALGKWVLHGLREILGRSPELFPRASPSGER